METKGTEERQTVNEQERKRGRDSERKRERDVDPREAFVYVRARAFMCMYE